MNKDSLRKSIAIDSRLFSNLEKINSVCDVPSTVNSNELLHIKTHSKNQRTMSDADVDSEKIRILMKNRITNVPTEIDQENSNTVIDQNSLITHHVGDNLNSQQNNQNDSKTIDMRQIDDYQHRNVYSNNKNMDTYENNTFKTTNDVSRNFNHTNFNPTQNPTSPNENESSETFEEKNWESNIRKVLRAWKNISLAYAYIHNKSAFYFYCIHVFIQLPVVLFSTLTAASGVIVFAFGSEVGTFHWVNIVTIVLSFCVAILSSCYTFFNPQKTREKHVKSCNDLKSYSKSIELGLLMKKSKSESFTHIQNKSQEYDSLIESMPPFPILINILFHQKLKKIENVSKYSSPNFNPSKIHSFFKNVFCCFSNTPGAESKTITESVTNSKNSNAEAYNTNNNNSKKRKSISVHISKCKPGRKIDSDDILKILYNGIRKEQIEV